MKKLNNFGNLKTNHSSKSKSIFLQNISRNWYKFSRSKLSIVGFVIATLIVLTAIFANVIVPYPEHVGAYVDFTNKHQPPSLQNIFGTDNVGRDIFSRVIYAYRSALFMVIVVIGLAAPVGIVLGLIAGYAYQTLLDKIIMRITDVFCGLPPFIMALAVASVLKPSLLNAMIAISFTWWPTYARITYGMTTSMINEHFVVSAKLLGAKKTHIIFREILPNCLAPIFTRMALEVGMVTIVGASLSFVGLGEQPPRPALGNMISEGAKFLPQSWWMVFFPALAIIILIMGFNLLGDGLRDMLEGGR